MVEYSANRQNLFLYIVGSLLFVFLGVLLALGLIGTEEGAAEVDRVGGIVIGWVVIIFFGAVFLVSVTLLMQGNAGPLIRMDDSGFYDRRICVIPIPWSEINNARIFRGKTLYALPQRFISLDVRNPEMYLRKGVLNTSSGLFKFLNALYGEPGITISTSLLARSPEEVLAAIKLESKNSVVVSDR